MDLFNTLGYAFGNIDIARERADTQAIEDLYGAEGSTEPGEYVVTVELTVRAYNLEEAKELAEIANGKAEVIPGVLDSDIIKAEQI
tara:strand:+ start:993 stop:1250 length:258 start_codon:yes stop_codon:yes gene_type:complete